jgi:hypothetical protein
MKVGNGAFQDYGVVLRIDPRVPDTIEAIDQDDLSDLISFRISMIGHYTSKE